MDLIKSPFNNIVNGDSRPPHGGRGLKSYDTVVYFLSHSRPPHGGRGLKSAGTYNVKITKLSSSTRGTWIEMSLILWKRNAPDVVLHTGDVD